LALQDLSDEQIMVEVQRGDGDAFTALFDRYQRLVLVTALKIVRDVGEAQEVTQSVFFEIFRAARRFDPARGSLKVWLLQYAYHRSINRGNYLLLRQFYQRRAELTTWSGVLWMKVAYFSTATAIGSWIGKAGAEGERGGHRAGWITLTSSHTVAGVVMGTASYMAPEQVRGEVADPRTDIFAFAAVLYEMPWGLRAFRRDTPTETMTAVLKQDPPELADLGNPVSPALERTVRCCLEKSPEQRFQSAKDLSFALSALSGNDATGGVG
jgi:serine/threonine protein kinase